MDYKELLIKYIVHIIDREGIDYIDMIENEGHSVKFTDEETAELEKLAKEAREKYNS